MKKQYALLSALLLVGAAAPAESHHHADHSEEHEGPHHNVTQLFLGYTHENGTHGHHDEGGYTVGVTYERRLSHLFGTGAFLEYAGEDFDKWSVGIPLFIHPYKGFRFVVGPGLEFKGSEDELLVRTGVSYEFELSGDLVLAPEFIVDFVDDEELYVFGISIGKGF